ncbi:MAG: hypothetical protein ABL901_06565 [Hyphomicrobiaceae bacterium]
MTLDKILTTVFACAAVVAVSPAARADDTGVGQSLHAVVKVGKKICFDGHSHSGSGTGASQKVAEMSAVNNWAGFTAWEYGTDWAHIGKAIKKSMKCGRSGGSFNCDVEATPCK